MLRRRALLRATRAPGSVIVVSMAPPPRHEFRIRRGIDGENGFRCGSGHGIDQVIGTLAEAQFGVVARWQLIERGVGRGAIEVRVRRGSLHVVQRGVYAVGHRSLGREGRWIAATLACGRHAVLSHRSAARCWGLLRGGGSGPIEISRPSGSGQRTGISTHRVRLPADERTVLDGIPVTTVPRTIFDLAAAGRSRDVERAFKEAEVRHFTDHLSIPDLLDRYPGHAGAPLLRTALSIGASGGATANDFEAAFADLLERHDLPRPRFNPDLVVGGRHFRPDCVWDDRRVIAETDGQSVHGTNRAFQSDRERDRILIANGWRVVRVTWDQVTRTPEAVVRDLRQILSGSVPCSP